MIRNCSELVPMEMIRVGEKVRGDLRREIGVVLKEVFTQRRVLRNSM